MQFERNGFSVGLLINGIPAVPDDKAHSKYFEVAAPGSAKFTLELQGKGGMVFIDHSMTIQINPSTLNPSFSFYFDKKAVEQGMSTILVEYKEAASGPIHIPIRITFTDTPSERRDLGSARPTIPDR